MLKDMYLTISNASELALTNRRSTPKTTTLSVMVNFQEQVN